MDNNDVSGIEKSIRITAICGSLSTEGSTKKALSLVLKGALGFGVTIKLIELRDYKLAFCGEVDEKD